MNIETRKIVAVVASVASLVGLAACGAENTTDNRRPASVGANPSPGEQTVEPTHPDISVVDRSPDNTKELNVFVQNWDDDITCNELTKQLPQAAVTRVTIGFPSLAPDGSFETPTISDACAGLARHLGSKATFAMAIGGWGDDSGPVTHDAVLAATAAVFEDDTAFIHSTVAGMHGLSEQLGQPVTGVTIDLEDLTTLAQMRPTVDVGTGYNKLIRDIRASLPQARIVADVPAQGFDFDLRPTTIDSLNAVEVMTYDKEGPWSTVTGPIAPEKWVLQSVKDWVAKIPAKKILVGYEATGYAYPGTTKAGQQFDSANVKPVSLRDISQKQLDAVPVTDIGSSLIVDGAWASITTPKQMQHTQRTVLDRYPSIGGAFVWSATNTTPAVYGALSNDG